MRRLYGFAVAAIVAVAFVTASAHAACATSTFTPNRSPMNAPTTTYVTNPSTHQALYLTDPANEQYALFDMEWGGGVVSLRYKPSGGILQANGTADPASTELIWGHDPGAMAQFALWTGNGAYNPNQAGDVGITNDWGRGSPVYSAACKNDKVVVQTTTADFGRNDPPWGNDMNYGRAAMIKAGLPATDMWFTPYSVTFTASFVPNPGRTSTNGAITPAYYLKIEQFIHSTDVREFFGTIMPSFALYVPHSFTHRQFEPAGCAKPSSCMASATPRLMAGLYPDASATGGVAVTTNASTQMANLPVVRYATLSDDAWGNQSVYLEAEGWTLPQGKGRRWIVYLQAGAWSVAKQFSPQ